MADSSKGQNDATAPPRPGPMPPGTCEALRGFGVVAFFLGAVAAVLSVVLGIAVYNEAVRAFYWYAALATAPWGVVTGVLFFWAERLLYHVWLIARNTQATTSDAEAATRK